MELWQIILYTVYILIFILLNIYALNGNRDQPSNTAWTNDVTLGRGYLFVRPMADGGVFGGNLFGLNSLFFFLMSQTLQKLYFLVFVIQLLHNFDHNIN